MKAITNPTDEPQDQHESTYALLMRSEEKSRNLLELVIYPVLIIVATIAIVQFALQAAELPSKKPGVRITSTSGLHAPPADRYRGI